MSQIHTVQNLHREGMSIPAHTAHSFDPWLEMVINDARESFDRTQWPTPEVEEYRRSDLSTINLDTYTPVSQAPHIQFEKETKARKRGKKPVEITFHNEKHIAGRNIDEAAKQGIMVSPLLHALQESDNLIVKERIAEHFVGDNNRIHLWQIAHLGLGTYVRVHESVKSTRPIVIRYYVSGTQCAYMPLTIIDIADHAEAQVEIHYVSDHNDNLVVNAGVAIYQNEGSSLKLLEVEDLGFNGRFLYHGKNHQHAESAFDRTEFSLGSGFSKCRFTCDLDESHAHAELKGLILGTPNRHADIATIQNHNGANCTSNAMYKGIVQKGGHVIHQGLITVGKGATQTDAFLTSRHIVLAHGARADAIPKLQIGNNDVRCSHGATTGRLRNEEMFYIMSRGFSPDQAKKALLEGFIQDIISATPELIQEQVQQTLGSLLEEHPKGKEYD